MEERFATYAGVITRELAVSGSGPPLLLLHGYAHSADTWRPLLRRLHRLGRAAVAVDLFPMSTAAQRIDAQLFPTLDRLVDAFVRHHATDGRVVIVGNSLGALAAFRAASDPDLPLAGVVALAPAYVGPAAALFARVSRILELLTYLPIPDHLMRQLLRVGYTRLASTDVAIERQVGRRYAAHVGDLRRLRDLIRNARSLIAEIDDADDFTAVTLPTLIVWGTRDRFAPYSGRGRFSAAIPHARFVSLAGLGHFPQLDDPARVADLLVGFDPSPEKPHSGYPNGRGGLPARSL